MCVDGSARAVPFCQLGRSTLTSLRPERASGQLCSRHTIACCPQPVSLLVSAPTHGCIPHVPGGGHVGTPRSGVLLAGTWVGRRFLWKGRWHAGAK